MATDQLTVKMEEHSKGIKRSWNDPMSKLNTLVYLLRNPTERRMRVLCLRAPHMKDEAYLKRAYRIKTGRKLNLDAPTTYTEKLQWLKLYDRRPEYTRLQDKYEVRKYVKDVIGEEYLIPLLGVWERAEDVDFDALPDQFVIKCNHDCASVIICRDKTRFDAERARERLRFCLQRNYYMLGREWAYKNIRPLIMAEKYMQNPGENVLTDYKLFCFSGEAKMVLLSTGEAHTPERRVDFYDLSFKRLPLARARMRGTDRRIEKPEGFEQLIQLAQRISGNYPFIRVDFYLVDGHPFFGEIAWYPSGGFAEFTPFEWEKKVGSWIRLPETKTEE